MLIDFYLTKTASQEEHKTSNYEVFISHSFFFLYQMSFLYAQPKSLKERQFSKYITAQIKLKGLKPNELGLTISSKQGEIYALNADQLFIPASLAKIPTLSALYHFYPVAYTFKTSFLSSASLKEGILKGVLF